MKKDQILKLVFFMLSVALISGPVHAQKKKKQAAQQTEAADKKKVPQITVAGIVVNKAGQPLKNVAVTAGEGATTVYTDDKGRYSIKTKPSSPILYDLQGYETNIVYLADQGIPTEVVLQKADLFASSKDVVSRGDGKFQHQRDIVGAVSTVNVDNLKAYPDLSLSNALQGQAAGLIARPGNGGFGKNLSSLYIRGQHSTGNNGALVIVDGVERDINYLVAEEIESVEVLKDVTAKMLYGPTAVNGVVLVTTKRGQEGRKIIRASGEYGVLQNTNVPEFLGAYEYASLYNEARANDGLLPRYSEKQLEGYRNSSGAHDVFYPDVDWYDEFLHNQSRFAKATIEFIGGNKNVKYSLVGAYLNGQGLEKVGKRTSQDQINVRGNLDIKISRSVTFKADVAGRLFTTKWAMRNQSAIMSAISSNKPNEYPLTIDPSFFGKKGLIGGIPYFGGSTRVVDNLYADLAYSGENKQQDTFSQMNLGLDFDLGNLVKGLSAEGYFTFDNYNSLVQRRESTYPTYSVNRYVDAIGETQTEIIPLKKVSTSTNQNISGFGIGRIMGMRGNVAYQRDLGAHSLSGVFAARYFKQEFKGAEQDYKNINMTLRLNYDYAKKYFAEVVLGCMGSNSYSGATQYMFAPTAGLSWIVSKEDFLRDVEWLDYLKVKASAGIMGADIDAIPVPYDFAWTDDGTWTFGSANGTNDRVLKAVTQRNPDLKWETQREFNVGVEAMMLSRRLSTEINYFMGQRRDIIKLDTRTSSLTGDFNWYSNVGQVTNKGVDAFVNWTDKVGRDFTYSVGVNFTYTKNRIDKIDEGEGIEGYRSKIGKPTSSNITLRYAGMFGRDKGIEVGKYPFQSFGPVQDGDLAYVDLNGDNIIDGRDQEMIGQSFPLTVWGLNINLNYKGFGLYLLGTAETGVQKEVTGNYFRSNGENSYSILARDAYHPVRNPNGSQPRLSTMLDGGNNWRNSEFWYRDCSFFRLKNIELSYTFNSTKTFFSQLKVFARGTNLFVLSPMKDADPERILAGVDNYPMYKAFTGGVSFTF